jgi:hypothetical protein
VCQLGHLILGPAKLGWQISVANECSYDEVACDETPCDEAEIEMEPCDGGSQSTDRIVSCGLDAAKAASLAARMKAGMKTALASGTALGLVPGSSWQGRQKECA